MSEIEKVRAAAEKLVKLTSDPHPGLSTWQSAVREQMLVMALPVKLTEYRCRWFDHLEWRWRQWDIIAESEAQARGLIDAQTKPEFRKKLDDSNGKDSLAIAVICPEVTMPFATQTDL